MAWLVPPFIKELGYGASSVIHSYKFWEITEKLPVTVEVVDLEENIRRFYDKVQPFLEDMRCVLYGYCRTH